MTSDIPEKYLAASYFVFFNNKRQNITFWGENTLEILGISRILGKFRELAPYMGLIHTVFLRHTIVAKKLELQYKFFTILENEMCTSHLYCFYYTYTMDSLLVILLQSI